MEMFEEWGWGDGLPIVPATASLVESFVSASGREPDEVIGYVPPAWGEATVEKIAINAAIAGCLPEYMPVVLAAVEAALEPSFNLLGIQATTHSCAPLVLVSGPVAEHLKVNYGIGAFGPGHRANATIGRSLRLVLLNLGGGRPGVMDMSTQGNPAKYTYCIAENDGATPWTLHRVVRGFEVVDSTVTVAALESPHSVNDHGSTNASELLQTIAAVMATPSNQLYLMGTEPFLFLCPEHAADLHRGGLDLRGIQDDLFQRARVSVDRVGRGQLERLRRYHQSIERYQELNLDDPLLAALPLVTAAKDLNVVVVGGPGRLSSYAPSIGAVGRAVTRRVRLSAS